MPKKKTVLPISTLHYGDKICLDSAHKHITEVVTFYNCTKSGADTVDKMYAAYSVVRDNHQ
jgi:hypothetical protein